MKPARIYLLGMMGVGKTTLGKKVAALLGWTFVDLDKLIEKREGRSIAQIFIESGEAGFRQAETNALRSIEGENLVVATGGGTPCFHDNMSYIHSSGASIYLRAPEGLILQRVSRYPDKRPLLRGMNTGEIEDFIASTLRARKPFYEQAHHVFQVPGISAETLVKSIGFADQ